MSINPLSIPKGTKCLCEMCGRDSTIMCLGCRVTFYCTKDHQKLDFEGIHNKICQLLSPLRTPPAVIGSEEERSKRKYTLDLSKRALIDLTKNESSKFLVLGQYNYAIPGALQALHFSLDVFGDGNVALIQPYLLLAEANLGMGKFQECEEFLSLANWCVVKNPSCNNLVYIYLKSQLYRNFGKLYSAQRKYTEALNSLANDIYFVSLDLGSEHVLAAGGYYNMGSVFFAMNKGEQGLAFLDKVIDIWYKFLAGIKGKVDKSDSLTEPQLAEAVEMIKQITASREKYLGGQHIATGEAKYTLGLLFIYIGDYKSSLEYVKSAYDTYSKELGDNHISTKDVLDVLNLIQQSDLLSQ